MSQPDFDTFVPATLSQGDNVPETHPQPPVSSEASASAEAEAAPEAKKEDPLAPPPLQFSTPPHNVKLNKPTVTTDDCPLLETIWLPAAAPASQQELMRSFPNMRALNSQSDVSWAQSFVGSMQMSPVNNELDAALSREGSEWRQGFQHNGDTVRSVTPKKKVVNNSELTGDEAIQAAVRHMRIGDLFHTQLFNSGFWVTFKPAPESVWMDINRQLGMEVGGITRRTYGLLHSTSTALAVSTIINAILPHVFATSVDSKEMPITSIPKYLSTQDEHDFIWGFVAANHPQGFNIKRSCIADPSKCKHEIEETIQVSELQICDWSALTPDMRTHMYNRAYGAMKLADVLSYQQKLMDRLESTIDLTGMMGHTTRLKLRIPSSETKDRMNQAYVTEVQQNVLSVVSEDTTPQERARLYQERETATEMRLYQHYVQRIDLGTNSISSPEDIAKTLGEWTRDYKLRGSFFDGMSKFINDSAISVIGLEAAVCPKCNADHSRPGQTLRGQIDYVPLDIVQVFSHLAELKSQIISREV